MTPLIGEYQLLEANTFTFSNSDGLEFLTENTLFPSMEIEYILFAPISSWPTSMLIHFPMAGRGLKNLE